MPDYYGKLFFGTLNRLRMLPGAISPAGLTESGYSETLNYVNGGADVVRSWASSKQWDLTWVGSPGEVNPYKNYSRGVYGDGLIYFQDPMSERYNLCRPNWATPALIETGDWKNIYTGPPAFNDVLGKVTVNLATNPSFERVVPGTDIVRRNLSANPSIESGIGGWVGFGGATVSRDTVFYRFGSASLKVVAGGVGAGSPDARFLVAGLTTGAQYTISAFVRVQAGQPSTRVNIWAASVPGASEGAATAVDWTRLSWTFTAVGSSHYVNFGDFRGAGNAAGATYNIDALLIESGSVLGDYFDGDTPDKNGFVYEWEGTPNASPSVVKAATVEVRRNLFQDPSVGSGDLWTGMNGYTIPYSSAGRYSYERVPSPIPGFEWAAAESGGAEATPAQIDLGSKQVLGVTAGRTYSMSMYVMSTKEITVFPRIRGFAAGDITGPSVTLMPGVPQRVSLVSTSERTGNASFIVKGDNASEPLGVNDVLYASGLLVEESPVVGDYFDGSTSPDPDLTPSWTGADNASESILSGVEVAGMPGGILSGQWSVSGDYSLRVLPPETTAPGFIKYLDAPGSSDVSLGPLQDRTLYAVFDALRDAGSYNSILQYSGASGSRFVLRENAPGSWSLGVRLDTSGGSNQTASMGVSEGERRRILWGALGEGLSRMRVGLDIPSIGGAQSTTPGDGITGSNQTLELYPGATTFTGVAGLAFGVEHSEVERGRVIDWLRLNYNATELDGQTLLVTPRLSGQVLRFGNQNILTVAGEQVRVYGSGPVGFGEGWWDDLLIVEGEYDGPYFDGNTEGDGNYTYAWEGLENGSASTRTARTAGFDQPLRSATYDITTPPNTATVKETIIIPPDKTLWLGVSGSATGAGVVQVTPIYASDNGIVRDASQNLTLLPPDGNTRLNTSFSGATYKAVEIYLARTADTASTVSVVSMMAQLHDIGTTPTLTGPHIPGEGTGGCKFTGQISESHYIAAGPGLEHLGASMVLQEVESWA